MPLDIVIVGSGIAPWMAASALARMARGGVGTMTVLETGGVDDSLGIPCAIETSLPTTPAFLKAIGIDEDAAIKASNGSFTLGIAMGNWTTNPAPAFHPFGETGASLGPIAFHQLAARLRAGGQNVNLANYSVAALCAQSGRFARPPANESSVLSTMEYGLHLESTGYAAFLKQDAQERGAITIKDDIGTAEFDCGLITALVTRSGERIKGDLFIDCSGPAANLISQMADSLFEDWSNILPCNSALSLSMSDDNPLPYTRVDAHSVGWQRLASVQGALNEQFIYQAGNLPDRQTDDAPYTFASGRQIKPWIGNCIAIGGAAAVIDPVASTQLTLTESAISRLISLLPHDRACRIEAAEYNRQTNDQLDCAFDIACLHYVRNGTAMPDRIAHRIAVYESCGRVVLHDGEIFETASWVSLFDALGITPRRYDPLADGIPQSRIEDHLSQIRSVMIQTVGSCPPIKDYINMCCDARSLENAA
jgi:tryptophan 7-halogenase